MKHIFFLLLSWLMLTPGHAQIDQSGADVCAEGKVRYFGKLFQTGQASGRQMAPTIQAVGDSTIDVTYYGLDLRVTTAPNYLRGATTVTLKANVPTLAQFYLDFNTSMKVDSVKSGAQKLTYSHQSNRLTITLPQAITKGQTGRVVVYYQGLPTTPNAGLTDQAFVFSTHETTSDPLIYTLSEPYGASDWFPCKDTPADKVDSSAVNVTMAPFFVSVSNGLLQGVTTNSDGTKTYRWKNSYPIAQYLISIAASNYTLYDNPFTYNGVTMPVSHYVFPEDLASVKTALTETNNMIKVFSDLFGTYPFIREKYGHAQFRWGGGMEHQTATSIIKSAMTRTTISHELMHQWFGDKITCRNWQNIWLNEGFASYGEAIYQESLGSTSSYKTYMGSFIARARAASGTLYVQNVADINQIFDSNRTYAKGAVVLHMLRGVLGDTDFFKGMKAYASSPAAYSTAVTEDFQKVMETASGKNLGYFFREWVYGEGYPIYSYSVAPVANSNRAVIRLSQTSTSTNPSSFTMPVQITVQSLAGDSTITVFNDQSVQSFTVTGKGTVTNVAIDPNTWILRGATISQTTTPAEPVVLATEEATQLRVFPNPGNDLLTAEFTTQTAGPLTVSLVNLLGQSVSTQADSNVPAGKQVRSLSLKSLPAGRYVLRLQTADGAKTAAVLVK
ncbi:M1 family aminopeptidase [Fibrella forsythiae]|uniref:Aminopeptidase N n=1 Tax=Fibrella forsythiae TaxID=2817061 RepID=A0ABS3JQE3_9BACT|nr:M1 family aminopeptidase [Fibrella forsythiae]MBO0952225.1 T9SS type A sorting domain-containing protein [Fibrella forsythiae]